MIVLILLAFVGMLTGIFLILGMTPFTFAEELTKPLSGRQQPISKRIQQVNHPKEPKGIRKTVLEAREMLILTGKGGKFAAICAFSLFLAAMGAVICIVIQNYFMLPVLAAGMGLLPFWYVLFTSHSYKKLMNNEIETGLSIITSSYLRSESMITAVEENIHYLNPPVADVFRGYFKFKTFGCGAAVATSSMATEMVMGKTIEEAMEVTNKAVMEALDGLPPVKVHCSLLAEEAIHAALWDYAQKHHIEIKGLKKPKSDIHEGEEAEEEEY